MPIKKTKLLSKYHVVSIGVFSCLLLFLNGCNFLPKEEAALAPPLVEPTQLDYQTVEVTKGDIITSLKGVGSMIPKNNIDLHYTKDGGRLSKIHVEQGDMIEEGQVLAELETGNLAFDIQQQNIELEKAKLRLQQMRESNDVDKYTIKIGELDVEALQNQLYILNRQMNEAKIISPINGVVTFASELLQGEQVTAYQSLFQVAETNQLQLQYQALQAADLNDVTLGMEAIITLNDDEVIGEVVQIPKSVPTDLAKNDPEFYEKMIIINIEDIPEDVNMGDMINFEIITAQKEDTLIIPKNALRSIVGRSYVQLVSEDTKREIDIQTGIENSTEVEVLQGLDEGDTLIVR